MLTVHPMVGVTYDVTYTDHRGKRVGPRRLTFLGRRQSEGAREFYPGEPGPVAMLDWEEPPAKTGGWSPPTMLGFRASDLLELQPTTR